MAAATLRSEERIGLVLAVAAHAGLIAWLALWRPAPEPLPLPDKVSVTLSEDIGLVTTMPDPSADPAPARGPQAGDSAPPGDALAAAEPAPAPPLPSPPVVRPDPAPPQPAPARSAVRPVVRPIVRPLPQPVAVRPVQRPTPRPTARPAPAPRRDAIADLLAQRTPTAKPASRPAARPAAVRPNAQPSGRPGAPPAARPGAPGFAEAFQSGVPGASGTGRPNAAPGPAEISSFKAVIRGRVIGPWNACSVTGLDVNKLRASVTFTMDKNGSVTSVAEPVMAGISDANRAQAKRFAECAMKAIRVGGPYKLPVEYYPYWKTYKFNFTKG